MRRKIIAVSLALSMLFTVGACGGNAVAATKKPTTTTTSKKTATTSKKPTTTNKKAKKPTLSQIEKAVKKAYGDGYLPSQKIDKETLSEVYGIKESMYDGVFAEGPMLSFQIDTFIAVKAKSGKAKTVKSALEKYKKKLISDSMQYPMNAAKLPAIQIYQFDNYVFFSMLVTPPDDKAETEGQILAAAKKHNKIAYNTIKKLFNTKK